VNLKADLHVHSTASDGRLAPAQLVREAARVGLSVLAITDHDSIEGIPGAIEAARDYPGLLLVPGVEINTDVPGTEVHILGYCMKYQEVKLGKALSGLREERRERGQQMVVKLADIGIHIDWNRIRGLAGGGAVGRPHVAQAMLEAGYVKSMSEAFDKYIGRNGPAYVERGKITPEKAVELIVSAGGFAVLAHPHSFDIERLEKLLQSLMLVGLSGLEVYYDGRTLSEVSWLVSLAQQKGLLLSGGSDFHGFGDDQETPVGRTEIPSGCVEEFIRRVGKHSPGLLKSWTLASSRSN